MKWVKKALAVTLAVMLVLPSIGALADEAENTPVSEVAEQGETTASTPNMHEEGERQQPESQKENGINLAEKKKEEVQTVSPDAIPNPDKPELSQWDVVQFNRGNLEFGVTTEAVFTELADDEEKQDEFLKKFSEVKPGAWLTFEADGSFEIPVEDGAFFPYEIQFTYEGKKVSHWFVSPNDTVKVGGHTFRVNAELNGTTVNQLSLKIAGKTIDVYPEKKTFTNDGDPAAPARLIPLERVRLQELDLTGFTPAELTVVEVTANILKKSDGTTVSLDGVKIVWKPDSDNGNDFYRISSKGDKIDLSYGSWRKSYNNNNTATNNWEMIVGDGAQLTNNNISYLLPVKVSSVGDSDWLTPEFYVQDSQGNRTKLSYNEDDIWYSESERATTSGQPRINRELRTGISWNESRGKDLYVALNVDNQKIAETNRSAVSSYKVVEGFYTSVSEAQAAKDVTSQILCSNMTAVSAGYKMPSDGEEKDFTIIALNSSNAVIGVMPFTWDISRYSDNIRMELYQKNSSGNSSYVDSAYVYSGDDEAVFNLDDQYALNGKYWMCMEYEKYTGNAYPDITAVYIGKYETIAQAKSANAKEITSLVCGDISTNAVTGYEADYSQGIDLTVFCGGDSTPNRSVYSFNVKTGRSEYLSSATWLEFTKLSQKNGTEVPFYSIKSKDDSYAEKNYITILIPSNVTVNQEFILEFDCDDKAKVYSASGTEEISGKSAHSFANGPVEYSVSAADGESSQNYWVQVKNVPNEYGSLYINSLKDEGADTKVVGNVVSSTREMIFDSYHDYVHDICFVNVGSYDLTDLSVTLNSSVVELDPYWTLNGGTLKAFGDVKPPTTKPDGSSAIMTDGLYNLAKVRLHTKAGVTDGALISGTLTIKYKENGIEKQMVLNLTGTVGDPTIVTESIPDAVKYVPYGTFIQNSNKYSWIRPEYYFAGGELPEGVEIKQNGELYGVPQETGTFTFDVRVYFRSGRSNNFPERRATFTLTVKENTNLNVYNESDTSYQLLTPIGEETASGNRDFYVARIEDKLFVSEGVFPNFIDLWLNGEKLQKGVDYTAESGSTRITIKVGS